MSKMGHAKFLLPPLLLVCLFASQAITGELSRLIKAAEHGDAIAQNELGLIYEEGRGVPRDYIEASKWFSKAAEQGNEYAQYNLGRMYAEGRGVVEDFAKAKEWFEKAEMNGVLEAQYAIGNLYYFGWGVKQNNFEAFLWYHKAAKNKLPQAQYQIAYMYRNGEGGRQNILIAIDWYYRAGKEYLKRGNRESALSCVVNINEMIPEHFLAKKLLEEIYATSPSNEQILREEERKINTGTGWVVGNGYIVTSNHVIQDSSNISLVRNDGSKIMAAVVIRDKVNDIVVLRPLESVQLPPALPLANNSPNIGASVFTIGFPHPDVMGLSLKLTSGKINALSGIQDDPRTFQISVPVQAGNSGGPLMNMKGEVVGIVAAKLSASEIFKWTGDLPQNVNYAIKVQYLIVLLDSIPKSRPSKTLEVKKEPLEALVTRIQGSIMMVIAE